MRDRSLPSHGLLLQGLLDSSPDEIFFKDQELSFVEANESLAARFGCRPEELCGRRLSDFEDREPDARKLEEQERTSLSTGRPISPAPRRIEVNGKARWLSEWKSPIRSAEGTIMGLVGIARDVTRQRNLEEQLLQSQKMEAVGKLAGGVAHDFNNLLVVIQSTAELMREGLLEGRTIDEELGELLTAAHRASDLTKQLLTFSRKAPVTERSLDLNLVVSDLRKMLRRVVKETIEVETRLAPGSMNVRGDRTQVEQVIVNLAINARDAMPEGGRLIITTEEVDGVAEQGQDDARYLCLSVRDTGSGMTPDVQRQVFDPFFSTKAPGKGTGLGLSTVYGILKQWGGHIVADSEVGVGTCFKTYWRAAEQRRRTSRPPPLASLPPPSGSGTILLVEDDPGVRRVTARILRSRGFDVMEAASPSEALRWASNPARRIDLLLSDVVLPEMAGPQLAHQISLARPGLAVLFMSGFLGDEQDGTAALSQGVLLEKPFTPSQLTAAVRNLLHTENEVVSSGRVYVV